MGIAAALCVACAGGAVRKDPLPADMVDSVGKTDPSAELASLLADRLDPEARLVWSGKADLDRDGRGDLAFLFRRPGEKLDELGRPCWLPVFVVSLRREDGTFGLDDAVVSSDAMDAKGCPDSLLASRVRVELAEGSIALSRFVPGRDSLVQRIRFAWSEEQATWTVAEARESWKLDPAGDGKSRWVANQVRADPSLGLEQFVLDSFARRHFLLEPGWRFLARKVADLDGDGAKEVVFATESNDPESGRADRFADGTRRLWIARILPGGRLALLGSNDRAIGGPRSGGALGDPFTRLDAGSGWFALEDMSGAAQKVSRRQVFRWSSDDRNWLIAEASNQFHLFHEDGADEPPTIRTSKEFGKIPWTGYDADEFIRRFEN
ncbi:MAG TPA: hypothetical protein PKO15_03500 [Fibrobacteria bacterium]|nr:hypothetical protein [Fibrobacteria bacterium]HOX51430.1 hypothetical protein [Fibrobacteria bacterium]